MQPAYMYPATGSSIHVVIALEQTMPEDLSYSLLQSLIRLLSESDLRWMNVEDCGSI